MINNVVLVGRVVEDPQLVSLDNGYRVTNLVLAVQRPFRNDNNEIDCDFIPMQAWMKVADVLCEYVGKGSIIGAKCRLQTKLIEIGDSKLRGVEVIVERVAFISTLPRENGKSSKNIKIDSTLDDFQYDDLNQDNEKDCVDIKDDETIETKKKKK